MVFKYPQVEDQACSVAKDFEFCDEVKKRNNGATLDGIVNYEKFEVQSTNVVTIGSLSPLYPMVLCCLHWY